MSLLTDGFPVPVDKGGMGISPGCDVLQERNNETTLHVCRNGVLTFQVSCMVIAAFLQWRVIASMVATIACTAHGTHGTTGCQDNSHVGAVHIKSIFPFESF